MKTQALAILALLTSGAVGFAAQCGYCHKSIEGTPYILKNKTHSEAFKCTYCAIAEAQGEADWKGDVTMISPSENPKKPVTVKRIGGQWKMFPTTAVFTEASPIKHKKCGEQFRAFTTKAAAQAYIKSGQADKVISLTQLIQKAS